MDENININSLELEIGKYVRNFGKQINSNTIKLNLPFELEVDGRFCDEYEDLDKEAPCIVDYLCIKSDSLYPAFHMYTNFSTNFPLTSNDKYSLTILGKKILLLILNNFKEIYGSDFEISEEKLFEINRSNWIKKVNNFLDNCFIVEMEDSKKSTNEKIIYKKTKTSFKYFIDCNYVTNKFNEDINISGLLPYNNINEMKQYIIDTVDNQKIALALKILYPTYDTLFNSGYLVYQTLIRYDRWRNLIPYIYDNIDKHISEDYYKDLILNKNPEDYFK